MHDKNVAMQISIEIVIPSRSNELIPSKKDSLICTLYISKEWAVIANSGIWSRLCASPTNFIENLGAVRAELNQI
jgi:hypothetical protein